MYTSEFIRRSNIAIFWVLVIVFTACSTVKKTLVSRDIHRTLNKSEIFKTQFTGFSLYDPSTGQHVAQHNADLYFTPASNTKILTALASLEAFTDSIPSFLHIQTQDTSYLEPLGDPTLLHPDFPTQPLIKKLKSSKAIRIHFPETEISPFGPGWAWDDYEYDFQTERAWMPVYANEVRIYNDDSLHIIPQFFEDYVNINIGMKSGSRVYRERKYNLFNIWMETERSYFERKIPFDYSKELALRLLSDTLGLQVTEVEQFPSFPDTLYNQPFLPVLATMMHRSDNFLAEQLLIVAGRQAGFTNQKEFRNYKLESWSYLPSPVVWVDGSGLSRYNLITPNSLVAILNEIYQKLDWSLVASIFPVGGESGTISHWYEGNPSYIYAKTGTLSNNHCLSGFLRARSGKIYIFSLMNNHYTRPTSEIKKEMQSFLESVRDAL